MEENEELITYKENKRKAELRIIRIKITLAALKRFWIIVMKVE